MARTPPCRCAQDFSGERLLSGSNVSSEDDCDEARQHPAPASRRAGDWLSPLKGQKSRSPGALLNVESLPEYTLQAWFVDEVIGQLFVGEHCERGALGVGDQL